MRIAIVLACACSATTPKPVIDGVVGNAEWVGARDVALDHGVQLRVRQAGTTIYFGLRGPKGFACVFVADGDGVAVHHASAKLGMATYTRASDGRYDPQAKDYAWKPADVMLGEQGWMGSTMRPELHDQELVFERIGSRRVAIGYLVLPPSNELGDAKVATWPPGLTDGVANVMLLAGFNPDDVAFEPQRWTTIEPR